MNILFVYERMMVPFVGGVERVTDLLAREMTKRGHNIVFLSVGPSIWNKDKPDIPFPQFYIPISAPDFDSQYNDLLRRHNISAILFQGNHPAVIKTLEMSPGDIKKFLTLHNKPFSLYPHERFIKKITPWQKLPLKGKLFKLLALVSQKSFRKINNNRTTAQYRQISRYADKLILLSSNFIPVVEGLIPDFPKDKLAAINNPNTFIANPKQDNREEKENIILFIGRLSNPQKNVTGFLDVWKSFSKRNKNWKAVIVGDGEDANFIKNHARKLKLENISFEGNCKNVEEYYGKAKILCMTSTYEGWGMVLTEAMAYGCVPVAYESFEAVNDIIIHGETGLLVAPFDKREMVETLSKLAGDEVLREKLSGRGKLKISDFSVDKIVDEWEKLLQ